MRRDRELPEAVPVEHRELVRAVIDGQDRAVDSAFTAGWAPKLPWARIWVADLLDSDFVRDLPEQIFQLHYIKLLLRQWLGLGFLPNDPPRLAKRANCVEAEFGVAWQHLSPKFFTTADGKHVYNLRMLREYLTQACSHLKTIEGGKKRAAASDQRDQHGRFSSSSSLEEDIRTNTESESESAPGVPAGSPAGKVATSLAGESSQITKNHQPSTSTPTSLAGDPARSDTRGTRLPENFLVTDEHREFAREQGLPNPDDEIGEFKDYWRAKPGRDGIKIDWNATFRNWLRRAPKYQPNRTRQPKSGRDLTLMNYTAGTEKQPDGTYRI